MADSLAARGVRPSAKNSAEFGRHNAGTQLQLVHEDVHELVRSLVAALGGAKVVGPKLFPQKPPDAAARYLLDCINPNRERHDLGLEEFMTLLRWARDAGVHFGITWVCDALGYTRPQPIEPEDQAADILRRVDQVRGELTTLLKQLERIPRAPAP